MVVQKFISPRHLSSKRLSNHRESEVFVSTHTWAEIVDLQMSNLIHYLSSSWMQDARFRFSMIDRTKLNISDGVCVYTSEKNDGEKNAL